MLKAKGTLAAAVGALVVATVLVAGFSAHVTSGAGTDVGPVKTATPKATATAVPEPTMAPANPPASDIEPPANTGTNPGGGELGVNNGPAGLPNSGTGPAQASGLGTFALLALLGFGGAMFAGAGAQIAAKRRG